MSPVELDRAIFPLLRRRDADLRRSRRLTGRRPVAIAGTAAVIAVLVCRVASVTADDGVRAEKTDSAAAAETLVLPVVEGAESPRAAAASNAGDREVAMALIDPHVRPFFETEVLLEDYMLEVFLLRNRAMTEKQRESPFNNLGAIPAASAGRDLVRTREIEIRDASPASTGEDRVVLTVDLVVRSWHSTPDDPSNDRIQTNILAVQRGDRWYLFEPFGNLAMWLLESDSIAEEKGAADRNEPGSSILSSERSEGTDGDERLFRLTYHVPIEVLHDELAALTQTPEATELVEDAQLLLRFRDTMEHRTTRGDFADLVDVDRALEPGEQAFESLLERYVLHYLPAIKATHRRLARPVETPP